MGRALIIASSILLGLGLVAPAMILHPSAGELTPLMNIFQPTFGEPRTISIWSGISTLLREGELFIGIVLLIFSVLFPIAKLCILWAGLDYPRLLTLAKSLSKYSMLDIVVLALIVVAIKRLPGGTEIFLGSGIYLFCGSILLSLLIPLFLRREQTFA